MAKNNSEITAQETSNEFIKMEIEGATGNIFNLKVTVTNAATKEKNSYPYEFGEKGKTKEENFTQLCNMITGAAEEKNSYALKLLDMKDINEDQKQGLFESIGSFIRGKDQNDKQWHKKIYDHEGKDLTWPLSFMLLNSGEILKKLENPMDEKDRLKLNTIDGKNAYQLLSEREDITPERKQKIFKVLAKKHNVTEAKEYIKESGVKKKVGALINKAVTAIKGASNKKEESPKVKGKSHEVERVNPLFGEDVEEILRNSDGKGSRRNSAVGLDTNASKGSDHVSPKPPVKTSIVSEADLSVSKTPRVPNNKRPPIPSQWR